MPKTFRIEDHDRARCASPRSHGLVFGTFSADAPPLED